MTATQVPPHNAEAEFHVLGAVLLSPGVLGAVSEVVGPGDFYSLKNGVVFRAFLEMDAHGEPIDAITVSDWLDQHGCLEDAGGAEHVHALVTAVPTAGNAAHYAQIVRRLARRRDLIRGGMNVARLGWEEPGELGELMDRAEQEIFGVTQESYRGDLELIGRSVKEVYDRVERLAAGDQQTIGLATGFRALDAILGGLEPGNLIVVAARPSMGKSALAHSFCARLGVHERLPVGLFTFEMSRYEVDQRLLASGSKIPLHRLRSGRIEQHEWPALQQATAALHEAPIYMDDTSDCTLAEVRSKARRLKRRVPELALLVIDYLQLMHAEADTRDQAIGKITRGLKMLARQLEIPVVLLSQLNRQVEQRHDKRPILSDLRDSGNVEQDADAVLLMWREEYYSRKPEKPGVCEINVAKHRNGPTGICELAFRRHLAAFKDLPAERKLEAAA